MYNTALNLIFLHFHWKIYIRGDKQSKIHTKLVCQDSRSYITPQKKKKKKKKKTTVPATYGKLTCLLLKLKQNHSILLQVRDKNQTDRR